MADSIRGALPPVYQHLFADFFDRPKVVETRATCDNCAMCDHGQPSPVPMEYFNSDTKCCTFFPQLPNYLVGAILSDPSPEMAEGKRRLQAIIAKRIGVTPQYLSRPRKLSLVMLGYGEAFGRAKSLLCPYYDSANPAGSCTIWRHREAICMTYYCKYVGGQRGYDFWSAMKSYLGTVQRTLIHHAAKAVDPLVREPVFKKNQLSVEDIDEVAPKMSDYEAWWGSWVGREEEFYVKCFEWVMKVTREEFAQNVDGGPGKTELEELISRYSKLETKLLPKSLVRNARMKEEHVGDKVVVTTYHRFDSFSMDKDLYEVVGLLRANETLEENLARLNSEHGIELAPELIEYLFAQGILVEPTKAKVSEAKVDATGELNGRRAALRAILEARGVSVNEDDITRIAAGDVAKLDTWIRNAANAKTIAEVLDG